MVDLDGRAQLLDVSAVEYHQPMTQCHRLDLVMSDIDTGNAEPFLKFLNFQAHLNTQLGIQVGQRFIEQKDAGFADNGAAHGDTLPLAAAELPGRALQVVADLQNFGGAIDPFFDFILGDTFNFQPVRHVVVNRHMGIVGIVLEHHGDIALGRFEIVDDALADGDFALADFFQARNHAQQRRLSTAAGTDDDDEFAVPDMPVDAVENLNVTIGLTNFV